MGGSSKISTFNGNSLSQGEYDFNHCSLSICHIII